MTRDIERRIDDLEDAARDPLDYDSRSVQELYLLMLKDSMNIREGREREYPGVGEACMERYRERERARDRARGGL